MTFCYRGHRANLTIPSAFGRPAKYAFQCDTNHQGRGPRQNLAPPRTSVYQCRRGEAVQHSRGSRARIRALRTRQAIPAPVQFPQEEPEEEDHCLLQQLRMCQVSVSRATKCSVSWTNPLFKIPLGAPQLHRPPGARPPRKAKTTEADKHLL